MGMSVDQVTNLSFQGGTRDQLDDAKDLYSQREGLSKEMQQLTDRLASLNKQYGDTQHNHRLWGGGRQQALQDINNQKAAINEQLKTLGKTRDLVDQNLQALSNEIKEACKQANSPTITAAFAAIAEQSPIDLEALMTLVQCKRATILEGRMKDQLAVVNARNAQTEKLSILKNKMAAGAADAPTVTGSVTTKTDFTINATKLAEINAAAKDAGLKPEPWLANPQTKEKMDTAINDLSTKLDSLTNTQQMDMLTLQSLNNKYNEAIELVSNFVKKCADKKEGIINKT